MQLKGQQSTVINKHGHETDTVQLIQHPSSTLINGI